MRRQPASLAQPCANDSCPPSSPLPPLQAFRRKHPGLLEALAATAAALTPAAAAPLLARLEAELPPTLTDVAPSGDCVIVAVGPGLAPLLGEWSGLPPAGPSFGCALGGCRMRSVACAWFRPLSLPACPRPPALAVQHNNRTPPPAPPPPAADKAAACCDAALADQQPSRAAATALAALSLASCLRFGGPQSAEPYAEAAVRCKQALKAAYDAGAAIAQEVSQLVCAHTHRKPTLGWLWPRNNSHPPLHSGAALGCMNAPIPPLYA